MNHPGPPADTQPRPVPPPQGQAPGDAGDWLRWARQELEDASDEAQADAEVLLSQLLDLPRSRLRLQSHQTLSAAQALRLAAWVERRRQGEPVAYLTGRQGFWSLELEVDPRVLIPRPDTETLVEWALELARVQSARRIADLGTGSGAVALALRAAFAGEARLADCEVHASDRSGPALQVARANAERLGLSVQLHAGDWFAALPAGLESGFDLVVSNPPYVADDDPHLPALRHEPRQALTAGADGLDAIRHLVAGAGRWLRDGGWLLLEHGHDQGAATRALLVQAGFAPVQTRPDLGGRERVSGGRWPA